MKHFLNGLCRFIAGILILTICAYAMTSCKSVQVLHEIRALRTENAAIRAQISRLDSSYRYNQTIIIQYEKNTAKAKFDTMSTNSLLEYIRSNP